MKSNSVAWNALVLGSVAAAGLGVFVAGSLSAPDVKKYCNAVEAEARSETHEISAAESNKDILQVYKQSRDPLAKLFRIVGQMLLAPIVMPTVDCLYNKYGKKFNITYE